MTMDQLKAKIRSVPDFPKAGILFYDITTLLQDAAGFRAAIDSLAIPFQDQAIEVVVAVESRGFIFGAVVADLPTRLNGARGSVVGKGGPYHSPITKGGLADSDKRSTQSRHGRKAMLHSGDRKMAGDAAEDAIAAVLRMSDQFDQRFGPRFRARVGSRPGLERHVKLHRLVQRGLCERVFDAQIRGAVFNYNRRAGKFK